jgi:hypothetical protein
MARVTCYSTRNLPVELRDRARLLAYERGVTLERLINDALRVGIVAMEQGEVEEEPQGKDAAA